MNTTFNIHIDLNNSKNFVVLFLIPSCFGCLIFVTNIFLALNFSKRRHLTKSTFVFLANLALTDIIFGFTVAVRPLLSYIFQQPEALIIVCRVLTGTSLMTAVQSVMCTLLLSVQVGILILLISENTQILPPRLSYLGAISTPRGSSPTIY